MAFLSQDWAQPLGISGVSDAETACNFVLAYFETIYDEEGVDLSPLVNTVGGSGGSSGCVANSTTSTTQSPNPSDCGSVVTTGSANGNYTLVKDGWPKPTWQAGVTGIPADGVRDLPDVSFFASDGFLSSSAYLICVSPASTCTYSTTVEPTSLEVGGTSVASPTMAGVMALINQKVGTAQGLPNSELYGLAAKQTYSNCSAENGTTSNGCYFNDIDAGTNAMPCDDGALAGTSPDCTVLYPGDQGGLGILAGYGAGAGFDLSTGLGSLNVANVVNNWTASVGSKTAVVTVAPAQNTIASSQSLSVVVTVASSPAGGTTPTGTVTLSGGGYTSSTESLSGGTYTFDIPADSLSGGSDTLTASYSGDATYAPATGFNTVTVTTIATLTPIVTVTPAQLTLDSGSSLKVTAAVSGAGPTPSGTVKLSGGGYTSDSQALDSTGSYIFTIPANSLSAGNDPLTVAYSGDRNYLAGSGVKAVTVTESAYTLSAAAASPASVSPGSPATSVVTLSSTTDYSGTVSLTCAVGALAGGIDAPTCSVAPSTVTFTAGTASGTATVTVNTTAASSSELVYPGVHGKGGGLLGAGGGALLACLVFLGIPARRRSWRTLVGFLVVMAVLGGLTACGGGGGSTITTNNGTTAGTYTVTVSAVGNDPGKTSTSGTFTMSVN